MYAKLKVLLKNIIVVTSKRKECSRFLFHSLLLPFSHFIRFRYFIKVIVENNRKGGEISGTNENGGSINKRADSSS